LLLNCVSDSYTLYTDPSIANKCQICLILNLFKTERSALETCFHRSLKVLVGAKDRTSFVQDAVLKQCNLIQRAYIVAQKAEALYDGSKTSPEQIRASKKRFSEALSHLIHLTLHFK